MFPSDYNPCTADRLTNTTCSGGVFVVVSDSLVCSEQPQFRTDCEIVGVKLEIVGSQPLHIAAFYKPREDDQDSLNHLRNSLEMITYLKGTILVLGDFNLPKFYWTDCEPLIRPDCMFKSMYKNFMEMFG